MSLLVRHAMTASPQTAGPDMTAADAAGLMRQLDIGVIPLVKDGKLVGLVTDRDLVVRVMAKRQDPTQVALGEIATTATVTVSPDMTLSDARRLMADMQIRRLPVVKGEELVGILSLGDVAVADASKRAVGEVLEEVSVSPSTLETDDGPTRGTPDRVHSDEGDVRSRDLEGEPTEPAGHTHRPLTGPGSLNWPEEQKG